MTKKERGMSAAAVALAVATSVFSAGAATNIAEQVVLAADADWRGLGTVTVQQGASIDLAGHALKVDGIDGGFRAAVDATSPSGTVEASEVYSGSAAFLFDNNFTYTSDSSDPTDPTKNHRVCVRGQFPFVVTYDFGEGNETCIRSYRFYYRTLMDNKMRAPKNWTFSGSNDKETWVELDVRKNETDWKFPDVRTFTFSNVTAFRYYRLSVSAVVAGDVLELYQLEYFTVPQAIGDETADAPERATASPVSGGSAAALFSNNFKHSGDQRLLSRPMPCDIVYDFGAGGERILNGYKIYHNSWSSTDNGRAPFDWEFQGSDDNENWTSLDTRANVTNWVRGTGRAFWFANGTPWRYYRLHVTKCGTDGYLEMYQLEFFSRPTILSKAGAAGNDLTEPGSEHLSLSKEPYRGSVSHLFDNNFYYRYGGTNTNNDHRILMGDWQLPFHIVYDFGPDVRTNVTAYKIYYQDASGNTDRAPMAWNFAGSNDGSTWTTLDRRENMTDWPEPPCSRLFSFANPRDYRYYRLQITGAPPGQTYLEMYQLEFFGGQMGELHVDVPAGTSQTNKLAALADAIRLVKDGAGSFTAACEDQTYYGGTVVSNGTLVAGVSGDAAPLGTPNDTDDEFSAITVCAGGTFDVNGFGGWWNYPVRLDGGTLRCAMATEDAPTNTFRRLALASDSRLAVEGDFVMGDGTGEDGCLDLGGHVLTTSVSLDGLWTLALPVTAGTIAFELGAADAQGGKKVMAWEGNVPPAGVTFAKAASGHRSVAAMSDGVYVIPTGTIMIVR